MKWNISGNYSLGWWGFLVLFLTILQWELHFNCLYALTRVFRCKVFVDVFFHSMIIAQIVCVRYVVQLCCSEMHMLMASTWAVPFSLSVIHPVVASCGWRRHVWLQDPCEISSCLKHDSTWVSENDCKKLVWVKLIFVVAWRTLQAETQGQKRPNLLALSLD